MRALKPLPVLLADDAPHLLVVDDDRRIRVLLSRFLLSEGYRVTTAETAADARAKLKGLRFDLIILERADPDADRARRSGEPHRRARDRRRRLCRQAVRAA